MFDYTILYPILKTALLVQITWVATSQIGNMLFSCMSCVYARKNKQWLRSIVQAGICICGMVYLTTTMLDALAVILCITVWGAMACLTYSIIIIHVIKSGALNEVSNACPPNLRKSVFRSLSGYMEFNNLLGKYHKPSDEKKDQIQ